MAAMAVRAPAAMWLEAEEEAPEPEQQRITLDPTTARMPPRPPHHRPGTRKPRQEVTPKTMTAIATQRVLLTSGRLFGSLLRIDALTSTHLLAQDAW